MAILNRLSMFLLCSLVLVAGGIAHAEPLQLDEQKIKAGLLYNFLKYTDWPAADTTAPMAVCIFGADPFGGALQPIDGRRVNQREITLRRAGTPAEAAACDLLFVNKSEEGRWPALRSALEGKPVLTVSDMGDFLDNGGMIAFDRRAQRIHASLNMPAVRAAGLSVQGRLLSLVTVTSSGGQ